MLSKLEKLEFADGTSNNMTSLSKGFLIFVLPESVLRKVLNEMDLVVILELSLSSKKSESIIHSCSIPVEMISFEWHQVSVFRNHYEKCDIKFDLIDCGQTENRFIGGCRFADWKAEDSGVISCYPHCRSALFNHLNTIFSVGKLFYTIDKWPVFQKPHELPRNAFSLTIPKVSNPELVEDTIGTILDYFDVEDTLDLEYNLPRLSEKVLQVKNLKLESVLNIPLADFLHHSNFKKLQITKHDYKSDEIRDGIFKWLGNGSKYLRLEYRRTDSDLYQFLRGISSEKNNILRFQKFSKRRSVSVGYNGSYLEFTLKKEKNYEKKKKTRFPLFRLPALPLREIFSAMNPAETLEISLLSQKAKLSIKSLNIRLKSIVLNTDQLKLTDETDERREIAIDDFLNRHELKRKMYRSQMIGESQFFTFVKLQEDFTKTMCCVPMNSAEHLLAFNHFLSLYKVGTVQFNISDPPDRIFTNFQLITNLDISGRLTRLPREVFNVPLINITTRGNIPFADFLRLNCSSIKLWNHRLTNGEVRSWIRHWKEHMTNIQLLSLEDNNYNLDIVLRGFTISLWQTRNEANREAYRLSCSGEIWEIQRDADGKKASVGLMGEFLELRVWKD
ncbi:hypothetical protein CRE_06813 [Caenorhabditis remanei]|uniref:F-box domain-containing protein n=1 Tax=Caenorhabditis remanei TaxID=31234 RepID=E3MNY0_CAERE|nr:hypothetical protein CRE_06813 [Caenorhabditis remanei]